MRAPIRKRFGARSVCFVVGGCHYVRLQLVRSEGVALTNVAVEAYDGLIHSARLDSPQEILIRTARIVSR